MSTISPDASAPSALHSNSATRERNYLARAARGAARRWSIRGGDESNEETLRQKETSSLSMRQLCPSGATAPQKNLRQTPTSKTGTGPVALVMVNLTPCPSVTSVHRCPRGSPVSSRRLETQWEVGQPFPLSLGLSQEGGSRDGPPLAGFLKRHFTKNQRLVPPAAARRREPGWKAAERFCRRLNSVRGRRRFSVRASGPACLRCELHNGCPGCQRTASAAAQRQATRLGVSERSLRQSNATTSCDYTSFLNIGQFSSCI